MLDRFRRRGMRLGAHVAVLAGPYAGSSGRISEVAPDGTYRVTIDDCCQPFVAATDLRVVKGRWRRLGQKVDPAEAAIDDDPEVSFVAQQSQMVRK